MLDYLQEFIVVENEDEYILNIWQPLMKKWGRIQNTNNKNNHKFESFLSKMMEMERVCLEEGDERPIVSISKEFNESKVIIKKRSGERWIYYLNPYGYQENWEIFKVEREKKV